MDKTIIIAAMGLVGSIIAGFLSFKAASAANKATADANRINEKKVDADAYSRSQGFYEKLLQEADRHLDRLRNQVEELSDHLNRVTAQLGKEQHMSDTLRSQVRELQHKVAAMEASLRSMHVDLSAMDPNSGDPDQPEEITWAGSD